MQVIYKLTGDDVRHRVIEWSPCVARGVTRSFGLTFHKAHPRVAR